MDRVYRLLKDKHIENFGWSGAFLKACRICKGMPQSHLAVKLGIRPSTLIKYEEGSKPIGIKLAKRLCLHLDIDNWRLFRQPPEDFEQLRKEAIERDVYQAAD